MESSGEAVKADRVDVEKGLVLGGKPPATRSNLARAVDRYRQNWLAMLGLIIAVITIVLAILAPTIRPHDPTAIDFANTNQWPSSEHWFGTDASGTDIFSQMITALRTSYVVAIIAQVIFLTIGMVVGLASGYFGGWIDSVLSRIIDVFFAFPNILVALLIAGTFGVAMYERFGPAGRLYLTVAALSLLSWVALARVIRSQIFSLREMPYIEAARVSGATNVWILRKHLLSNVLGIAAVMTSLGIGSAMTLEAVLSYLGLGVTPPTASLGRLIQQGQIYLDPHWYQFFLPAAVLATLVLAYAFVGDGVRDALDPRMNDTR
jgi:ABC-type dipeptide/oligopeptide/nickel transport system permease subunit